MLKILATVLILFNSLLLAQSPPNATGAPETMLAGIDPRFTSIATVQEMYGQQEAVFAIPPDPYPEGTKLYKWGRLTLTLKVLTEPSPHGEVIRVVQVIGEGEPGKQAINSTARGLSLGAKAAEVKKLYGIEPAKGENTLRWSDGTTLVIGINDKGRVSKLELRTPSPSAE